MFDTVQFYPTPEKLVYKLVNDIDFKTINTVLEPSAGNCNICDVINTKMDAYNSRYNKVNNKKKIDCIEISNTMQTLIREKGYRVVGDDFLNYNTYKHYDLIAMNPPFKDGDKHLLKAIQIGENNNGAKIRCILSAETLKNLYSNTRKLLLQKIEKYNGTVEYVQDAFVNAEVKTDVEIAIIKLDIEKQNNNSIILDSLKKEEQEQVIYDNKNYEVSEQQEFINAICKQYELEVKTTVRLINEYKLLSNIMLKDFEGNNNPILELRISGDRSVTYNNDLLNDTIKEIRYKYWKAFFTSDKMTSLMTSNIRKNWNDKLEELKEYDFSTFNVRQVELEVKMSLKKGIEDTILDLFDKFTGYAMQDGTNNIHYFTGWKTNNAYKLGEKVIMPYMNAFDRWTKNHISYNVMSELRDIEKVFNYIDSGILQMEHIDMGKALDLNFKYGETRDIELKYFSISFFKKGTAHLKFNDRYKDVLTRFNYIACHLKGWLPDSYGKKQYRDMTKNEQDIVRSFFGSEDNYNKEVMENKHLYELNIEKIKLIG